jgi:hypothetical protein
MSQGKRRGLQSIGRSYQHSNRLQRYNNRLTKFERKKAYDGVITPRSPYSRGGGRGTGPSTCILRPQVATRRSGTGQKLSRGGDTALRAGLISVHSKKSTRPALRPPWRARRCPSASAKTARALRGRRGDAVPCPSAPPRAPTASRGRAPWQRSSMNCEALLPAVHERAGR